MSSYQYNGLGDRLSQNGVNYTLDLNAGLTQVLSDGTTTYGLGRISQQSGSTPEYFLGDALGLVRQLTSQSGQVTYTTSYDPYGVVTQSGGAGPVQVWVYWQKLCVSASKGWQSAVRRKGARLRPIG